MKRIDALNPEQPFFVYYVPGGTHAPSVLAASYNIKAEVTVPEGGAEGIIVTQGGRFGGYGFYLLKGKPVFTWNLLNLKRVKWEGPGALSPGKHVLEYDFKYDGLGAATLAFNSVSGLGRSGTGVLKVDGKAVATITLPKTTPLTLQWDENFDVGADTLTGVDDQDYQPPFRFTGKLDRLTLTIGLHLISRSRRSADGTGEGGQLRRAPGKAAQTMDGRFYSKSAC